jgi:hypothetical protein
VVVSLLGGHWEQWLGQKPGREAAATAGGSWEGAEGKLSYWGCGGGGGEHKPPKLG